MPKLRERLVAWKCCRCVQSACGVYRHAASAAELGVRHEMVATLGALLLMLGVLLDAAHDAQLPPKSSDPLGRHCALVPAGATVSGWQHVHDPLGSRTK